MTPVDMKRQIMRRLSEFKDDLYQKPMLRNLFWEATTQCNLSCSHCGSDCDIYRSADSITGEEMRVFFTQFAQNFSPKEVMLNITGGEPLLRSDLFEVMEQAAKLGFVWGMTTNGTLLTDTIIRKMVKTNCRTVSISLDGMAQSHNSLRGLDCFEIVIKGIKRLTASEGFSNIQVTTVVHKNNIHELPQIYTMLEGLAVDSWRLTNIDPIGRANKMESVFLSANDLIKLFEFIRTLRRADSKLPVSYGCSHYATPEFERDIRDHYYICGAGILTASILNNGDIFACVDIDRKSSLIQGNIRTDDFSEVWQKQFKQFRQRRDRLSSICADCSEAQYCRGDSAHTWDFDNNKPKYCLEQLLVECKAGEPTNSI